MNREEEQPDNTPYHVVKGQVVGQPESSTASSNIVLGLGAPSFGGGGSFETLDFSMPSYDQATSGDDSKKSDAPSAPSFLSPKSDEDAAAAAAKKAEGEED